MTIAEAALLVALPRSPSIYRPDRHQRNAKEARAKVLKRLRLAGMISSKKSVEAENTPIEAKRHRFPFLAPHLARRLLFENPGAVTIHTHIVPDFQAAAADIVDEAIRPAGHGVNAAAIIIENRTARVLAYVASSGFFDATRAGQVDFVRAIRSPGSALKPFIYAMAFDEMIAHPKTVLADREKRFGGYRPVNFDGSNHGQVTARYALQASLNVPAVTLLNAIGPRRFLSRLHDVGVSPRLRNIGSGPGLAVALGGVGVSLEQLAALYSAIARGGAYKDLSFSKDQDSAATVRLFGQRAADAVADILKGSPRPQGRYEGEDNRNIAFKTGTSSGYRDVLALGFEETYTVGVWIGHPGGKPMPGKTGINMAAPVLFRVLDFLPTQTRKSPKPVENAMREKAPKNLKTLFPAGEKPAFSISFPVDGSNIPLPRRDSSLAPVYPIKLRDGERPFSVFVNGKPIRFGSLARSVTWNPRGPGFLFHSGDRQGRKRCCVKC